MKAILLFLIITPLLSISQEPAEGIFPLKDSSIYYERIVNVDSLSKDDLYKLTKSWGVSSFGSLRDPLKADDKESGLIAYQSALIVPYIYSTALAGNIVDENRYNYSLKIYIKEYKVKVTISDIYFTQCSFGGRPQILTLRSETEDILKRGLTGKNHRERIYEVFRGNFETVNQIFMDILASFEKALRNGRDELDF